MLDRLYKKYLDWRLNKINLEIQEIQFFTHFTKPPYSNPPTPLFPTSYVKYKFNRLEKLQSKRKQLTSKLNPELTGESIISPEQKISGKLQLKGRLSEGNLWCPRKEVSYE